MNGLFFLAMLVGIVWLCVWGALPRPWKGGGWWPFDMRQPDGEARTGSFGWQGRTVQHRAAAPVRRPR